MSALKKKHLRYIMAECECGWTFDGYAREPVERAREQHAGKCVRNITRLTSSVTWSWTPPTPEVTRG